MAWKNLRVREDLYRLLAERADTEQRSVAQMGDLLLMWALEQATGNSPKLMDGPSRLTGAPSSARASNTTPSSGGGPASAVIPGETDRGAGVDLPEVKTSGAALANDVEGASKVDPAPLDPEQYRVRDEKGNIVGWTHATKSVYVKEPIEGQTDIYEMLAACPECAGAIEQVGDESPRCVECGYRAVMGNGGPCMSCGGNDGYGPAPHHTPGCYFASFEGSQGGS